MNEKVNSWLGKSSEPQRLLLTELRRLILDTDVRFTEEIKWGRLCYSINKLVCYLQIAKEHVTIGFQQGAHLKDARQLLVGEGKDMRHVKIRLAAYIDHPAIANLTSDAVEFDCR